ncbi:MAG: hypothetical protein HDR01_06345 [Lachnospiraceae bacterium]|nr:hypothetical protein [Lachnospiraceae bacterium]
MKRSKSQAVYKFLPAMWVSEKTDSGRSVTAEIKNWNNKKMENIYHSFIEGEIKRQINLFGKRGGDINAFNLEGNNCFVIVEPACNEGIPDIIGTMSPLLFYCSSCQCTFQKNSASQVNDYTWKCPACEKYSVKQLQMIYTCECGYAQPIKRPIVKGVTELLYKPNQNQYKMYYRQGNAEKVAEFAITCPNCQSRLIPDNAESSRNYKPFSLRIINLVDKRSGDFFEKGEEAQKVVIAKWFEKLTQDEYEKILDNVALAFSDMMRSDEQRKEVEKTVQGMVDAGLILSEQFEVFVNNMLATKQQSGGVEQYVAACDSLFAKLKKENEELYKQWISGYAYKLMQYDTIKYARRVFTLQDAIDKQMELEFIDSPDDVLDMNKKLGILNMQVSCDIEIINCTYGYTRKASDPVNNQNKRCRLKLNAYDKLKGGNANLVYGAKLETEGILFEISQRKIIEWLLVNKVISEEQLPDIDDELSVKRWFAENVKGDVISAFGEIDEEEKITKYVFGLLHSMSHAFIKTTGEISGLAGNSLTEIIIVETASIFMYAQTTQAIPLGALSGMAENNYVHFLNKMFIETRNCVFDPICTDRDDTSCSACMIIPEISCNHFNNELGRKYLYTIDNMEQPLIGFWEM